MNAAAVNLLFCPLNGIGPQCHLDTTQDLTISKDSGHVYVYGGCQRHGDPPTNSLHRLDIETKTWMKMDLRHCVQGGGDDDEQLPSLLGAAMDIMVLGQGDRKTSYLLLFGGCSGLQNDPSNEMIAINLTTSTWEYVEMKGETVEARTGALLVAQGKRVFVFGGGDHPDQHKNLSSFSMAEFDDTDTGPFGTWVTGDDQLPTYFRRNLIESLQGISVEGRGIVLTASKMTNNIFDMSSSIFVHVTFDEESDMADLNILDTIGQLPADVTTYITWATPSPHTAGTDDMIIALNRASGNHNVELYRLALGSESQISSLGFERVLASINGYIHHIVVIGNRVLTIGSDDDRSSGSNRTCNIAYEIPL